MREDGPERRLAQGTALGVDLQGGEERLRLRSLQGKTVSWLCLVLPTGLGRHRRKLLPAASEVTGPML